MRGNLRRFILFASYTGIALLGGCQHASPSERHETAFAIAQNNNLRPISLQAPPFILSGFERIQSDNAPIHIYIEGDGLAWLSRNQPSLDPTPPHPTALKLAAQDHKSPNIVYLARPCQYSGRMDGHPCVQSYWMGRRYAPEVLQSYNIALDTLRARYGHNGFHLTGFSGGGAIAAILAAQRDDIKILRSVAGNLDHRAHSETHNISYLDGSLNPTDYAQKLAHIAQIHFIGGADKIVPPSIYQSYHAALPDTSCSRFYILPDADHNRLWTKHWSTLLDYPVPCAVP